MKKLIRLFGFTILSLLSIIILVVGILSFLYSPGYVYRLAKYNVADVYDYIHFENREIQAADSAFSFPIHGQILYFNTHWLCHLSNYSRYQFFASGNLGQEIYIIPREETIIVHCGNSLEYYNSDVLRSASEKIM